MQHKHKLVVCYGNSYRRWFEAIASHPFLQQGEDTTECTVQLSTVFVLINHPAARGMSKTYFEHAGNQIRQMLKENGG